MHRQQTWKNFKSEVTVSITNDACDKVANASQGELEQPATSDTTILHIPESAAQDLIQHFCQINDSSQPLLDRFSVILFHMNSIHLISRWMRQSLVTVVVRCLFRSEQEIKAATADPESCCQSPDYHQEPGPDDTSPQTTRLAFCVSKDGVQSVFPGLQSIE